MLTEYEKIKKRDQSKKREKEKTNKQTKKRDHSSGTVEWK